MYLLLYVPRGGGSEPGIHPLHRYATDIRKGVKNDNGYYFVYKHYTDPLHKRSKDEIPI